MKVVSSCRGFGTLLAVASLGSNHKLGVWRSDHA
jgi:hypothetical protein